jgi:hypothetical protein
MARKRKRRERQREPRPESTEQAAAHAAVVEQDWRLPSLPARVAGGVLASVTLVIAVVTVVSSFSGDLAAVDMGARLVVGVLLIALAIFIAALSIVPGFVRGLIVRS